jgi:hypothetical protein
MITEDDLKEANGLIAKYYSKNCSNAQKFDIWRKLSLLGIKLNTSPTIPDPRAPEGGSSMAMREAA